MLLDKPYCIVYYGYNTKDKVGIMKRVLISFAASLSYVPDNTERTAKKMSDFDVVYQTWPSRKAMAKEIRLQQSRPHRSDNWTSCIPLKDNE